MSEATKEITDRIVSDSHLLVVIFYNNCWMSKPNLFNLLTIGFPGKAGLTGKLCRTWTSGCSDCYHWATRAPWLCPSCWSRCHDQTLLWTGFKGLLHFFVHGSWWPRATDTKDQRPAGGVDHTKSDSTINDVLQSDIVTDAVVDAIIGTCTASWD